MLDTHIAVALFEGRTNGLSTAAKRAVDRDPLSVSPAVLLELELLHEIGRLRHGALHIAGYLDQQLGISQATDRFSEIARQALEWSFTRDPFDRLIVAHAHLRGVRLLSLDARIAEVYQATLS